MSSSFVPKYMSLRPTNGKCNAMFLTPLRKPTAIQWYADSPLGKNTLGSTVKNIMQMAGIDGDNTIHSCRRTAVTFPMLMLFYARAC